MVYSGIRHLLTLAVSTALALSHVVYQTALKGAGKYLFLMLQERRHTLVLQLAYHAGAHVHHFLVFVKHTLVHDALAYLLLDVLIEECQEQLFRFFVREDL